MLKGHRQASETILQVRMTPFGCWYPKEDLEVSTTIIIHLDGVALS
jgi:hypothetical protein